MSDHFALVPRALADRFFLAITAFYGCDESAWPPSESWWQPKCMRMGFEESVLFRHLHFAEVIHEIMEGGNGGGGYGSSSDSLTT